MNKLLLGYVISSSPNFGDWEYSIKGELYMAKVTVFENRKTGTIMNSKLIFEPLEKMDVITRKLAVHYLNRDYYKKPVVYISDINDLLESQGERFKKFIDENKKMLTA